MFWEYSLAIKYIINPENYHSKILASNCAMLFSFLLGLHVFPTFVIYELTVLLFLTLSVVIMKVFSFSLLKNILIFINLSNLCAACPKNNLCKNWTFDITENITVNIYLEESYWLEYSLILYSPGIQKENYLMLNVNTTWQSIYFSSLGFVTVITVF